VRVRIGTRGSRLAVVQAEEAAAALGALGAQVDIVTIRTSGDRLAQVALADFGGKALFVKEIEEALLAGEIDLGVHSLKDVPAELPDGLCIAAYPQREDPGDVLVGREPGGLADLRPGATVGTSSLRRQVLVRAARPDLRVESIRGNVDTRLRKLEAGLYDALVLARAGLNRLGLWPGHASPLPPETFIPAVGQGILGMEARADAGGLLELLQRVDHTETRMQALAERSFLLGLGAGCHTPVAGWARMEGDAVVLTGLVASRDGDRVLRGTARGPGRTAEMVGSRLARELLAAGAADILEDPRAGRTRGGAPA
jgi:hydroxymethylbilane synthase